MVLVDTSVWIDHLRYGNGKLEQLLEEGEAACHPFIIGELACGNLKNRHEIIDLLNRLPQAPSASHREVMYFIENQSLMGRGLGYIDINIMASARIADMSVWTLDTRLEDAGRRLHINFETN
jgi:predicted nucleic acid-binding protein